MSERPGRRRESGVLRAVGFEYSRTLDLGGVENRFVVAENGVEVLDD